MRTRVPPPATGDVGPLPGGAYGAPPGAPVAAPGSPYAPPSGSFSYNGGQLTPVTPPPSGAPPPAAAIPAAPYGAQQTPTYQAPAYQTPTYQPPAGAAPPPLSQPPNSPPYTPPGGGWAPTSSVNGPPTTSIYNRETMQRELRPLGETARAGVFSSAATDLPTDQGGAPGELGLDPADKLSQTPMAGPIQDAQDTRAIEPVSYNVPQGAPPRTISGAYAALSPADKSARPRRPAAGSGPADHGATYGFDANYAWLQGQLEYSDATKQWKLRYVPINGPTDRYGGSVVLGPTPALAGYRAGDFVSVKGQVASGSTGQGSYAPLYQVAAVDRLSD